MGKKGRKLSVEQRAKLEPTMIKPGEIKNPNGGKSHGFSLSANLRQMLDKEVEHKDPLSVESAPPVMIKMGQLINNALMKRAGLGDLSAINMVYDRTEGQAVQTSVNYNVDAEDDALLKLFEDHENGLDSEDEETPNVDK